MDKSLIIDFEAEVIHWRGPAPYFFLKIPVDLAPSIKEISKTATYGWGVIPTEAAIDGVEFYTALIPKDDSYLLPLKKAVREALNLDLGSRAKASLQIEVLKP